MKIVLIILLPVIFAGSIFSQTNDMMFVLPSCPAKISQESAKEPFFVNLNQTSQELTIEILQSESSNQRFSVEVINACGLVVYSNTRLDNVVKINTKDFSAGVYAVRIKYDDKFYVYKTLKF